MSPRTRRAAFRWAAGFLLFLLASGLARAGDRLPAPAPGVPASPALPAAKGATALGAATLVVGEFALGDDPATDGDTIRLLKPEPSVRVLCVDAEEVFHGKAGEADAARAAEDFDAYAREKRGTSKTPVKYGTPAGLLAKAFAADFFRGVRTVRLERDEEGRDFDGYGRRLAHVFAEKDGKGALYAEALVRAGLSPYFVKYGRSRRFDSLLSAAEAEARSKKRGIWGGAVKHYPDYGERLAWWEERAKQVDAWDKEFRGDPPALDHVRLGVAPETARLAGLLGRRVTLFSSVEHVDDARSPRRLLLVDGPRDPFPVVVFDDQAWAGLDREAVQARFVRVSGTLSEYRGHLQVVIEKAADIDPR